MSRKKLNFFKKLFRGCNDYFRIHSLTIAKHFYDHKLKEAEENLELGKAPDLDDIFTQSVKVAIEKFLKEILNILNVIFDPQYCMEKSKCYFNNEGWN